MPALPPSPLFSGRIGLGSTQAVASSPISLCKEAPLFVVFVRLGPSNSMSAPVPFSSLRGVRLVFVALSPGDCPTPSNLYFFLLEVAHWAKNFSARRVHCDVSLHFLSVDAKAITGWRSLHVSA